MKRITKLVLAFLIMSQAPSCLSTVEAQNKYENSKYLVGAVPEVNGKVVFSQEFSIPHMSKDEIYKRLKIWMTSHMKKNKNNSRLLYTNIEQGQLVATGDEYIVFRSTALSLDRTRILYILASYCYPEKCKIEISKIHYTYRDNKEEFKAEEWITDKYALNKSKTKLVRGLAKWRTKTVDFMDGLFKEAADALSASNPADIATAYEEDREDFSEEKDEKKETPAQKEASPIIISPKKQVITAAPQQTVQQVNEVKEVKEATEVTKATEVNSLKGTAVQVPSEIPGYKVADIQSLDNSLIQMGGGKLVIVIGTDQFNMSMMTANAGGSLGNMNGKKVVFTILTPDQPYQQMEKADNYVVRYYPNGEQEPTLIFQCKRMTSQPALEGQPRMYIGEIIKAYKK